jgi:putative peptidoglycan lipid II flippase
MMLSITLGILAGINLFITLFVQWYILLQVGAGADTDALFASITIPQIIVAVFSDSLSRVLIPMLSGEDDEIFHRLLWSFLTLVGVFFSLLMLILYISAPLWVPLLFPGFQSETHRLTVQLTRIQLIGMVFTLLWGVVWAANHARNKFIWVETTVLISAVVGLIFILLTFSTLGIISVAWSNTLRVALQTLLLFPIIKMYRPPDWRSSQLKDALKRLWPLILGASYYKMDPLVDRYFSSLAAAGSLSLLYFAQQIYRAGNMIVTKAIDSPLFPRLAHFAKAIEWESYKKSYRSRLGWMLLISTCSYLLLIIAGRPIFSLLIGYGAVSDANVTTLWLLMVALGGVVFGGLTGQIFTTAFYAKGNTVMPTRVGVIGFTLGVIIKVLAFSQWGVIGLAAGTSIYYILNAITLYILIEGQLK